MNELDLRKQLMVKIYMDLTMSLFSSGIWYQEVDGLTPDAVQSCIRTVQDRLTTLANDIVLPPATVAGTWKPEHPGTGKRFIKTECPDGWEPRTGQRFVKTKTEGGPFKGVKDER